MKKVIILLCALEISAMELYAQNYLVYIEPIGNPTTIFVPAQDVLLGAFNVIVIPNESYHLDSCWLGLHGVPPQVIMNLWFNRSDYPQYNPYQSWGSIQSNHFLTLGAVYNFPPVEKDTTRVEFIADIGVNVLPVVGSSIFLTLQCSGFSLTHEEIVTNTAQSFPLLIEWDPNMAVEDRVFLLQQPVVSGRIGILEINTNEVMHVYNLGSQLLWTGIGNVSLSLSPGVYICWYGDRYIKTLVF